MPTITIRNLEEHVKQRLRVLAAQHGRSMEAEVREILTREVLRGNPSPPPPVPAADKKEASVCTAIRGTWQGRMSTNEIMALTRGE